MVNLLKKVNTDNSYDEFNAFTESSYFLYQKLIAPFIDHITNKKIIFIPDGEINYISFDALILDSMILDRPDYRRLNYLIKHFKTNVANSMQIYFNMKKRSRKPNDQVYAFAPFYPLFPNTDSLPEVYRNLRPLDYAGTEVKAISRIMSTIDFEGKEATKINFQKNAKKAGILHLAMHTIINDEEPLHSKLLFTHEDRSQSSMLNTFELLSLELNAELAVLSGCSTGEGKLQKGEGVMSLSSGFQYAGVPAIVMSLWEVNDRFGSLVIQKFYENLAQGMDKKQSLYKAKVEVLGQGNALYAHPYYWAGLTLMGDDSKIAFIRRYQWDKIVIVFTPILFIIVLLFQMRKKWKIKRA
jgi:CHAT domain-containing protein